jgi:hypothetical protein
MAEDDRDSTEPPEVSDFFDAISAFESSMVPSLSYLGFRRDDCWQVFRARINYNFLGADLKPFQVRTANVIAGAEILAGGPAEARHRVREILRGSLSIPGERLLFPPQYGGGYHRL